MKKILLHNHVAAPFSELELQMANYVTPGGNWQQIPSGLSERVDQIKRRSENRGLIHTTYYGRLLPNAPSYTISTYYNRIGNGCHLHPTQMRVISDREAARLQSFPDSFIFLGTNRAVTKQIGNAVPPLLGAIVGKHVPGETVLDLFAGAGGMSHGLIECGKKVILAVENDKYATQTYQKNHPDVSVWQTKLGTSKVTSKLIAKVNSMGGCDIVVGGPPCQSFSTAGNRENDQRSTLIHTFADIVTKIMPKAFVMENVYGLKSFQQGQALKDISTKLTESGYSVSLWDIRADQFGIPQRRRRLFLIGSSTHHIEQPKPIFPKFRKGQNDTSHITVSQAISDLPVIEAGDSHNPMWAIMPKPSNIYQELVRGEINSNDFFRQIQPEVFTYQPSLKGLGQF